MRPALATSTSRLITTPANVLRCFHKSSMSVYILSLLVLVLTLMYCCIKIKANSRSTNIYTINCTASCDTRCSETKRPNLCKRACGSCCGKCNCVPPGTSGNYEACPCYFNLKTHNNTRKCP
ncbi:hypothetical protein DCAR_0518981 [Daucus carota subsp. sativus]|uniref:Gibberellin regulated protein n=1 Tax=Daucus carota subsp. sativus TaxID=79200 RepID=A0AAF1AY42_DAUCS|nr:hypothetical protein DCAR_0518981 [Daucus carota subsp. sativus]